MTSQRLSFRAAVVAVVIVSFTVAALAGVVVLLSAATLDGAPGQVLWSTLLVGIASLALLCNLATAETPWFPVGLLGSLAALTTLGISLLLVWGDQDGLWKPWGMGSVITFSLAQVCLLLAGTRRAAPRVRMLVLPTLLAIAWVGGQSCLMIADGDWSGGWFGDVAWRVLGIAAIADVLGTLVVGALARSGRPGRPSPAPLTVPADLAAELTAYAERVGRSPEAVLREAVERVAHGRSS